MKAEFKKDVKEGLSKAQKTLPSKYFYNKKGDKLFQEIMAMPEYYLFDAEMEIFSKKTKVLIEAIQQDLKIPFELVELGAGDGTKTYHLLKELLEQSYQFTYLPVDISANALEGLQNRLSETLPNLNVKTLNSTYHEAINKIHKSDVGKVILFLGSNLGNLLDHEASKFLSSLSEKLNSGDKVLLGLDKIKSVDIVLPAYNDAAEITKEFNLNLLDRINDELQADFNRDNFKHTPEYAEEEGIARSFLTSTKNHSVYIGALNESFHFHSGEKIHTEISRKYSKEVLSEILKDTHLSIKKIIEDDRGYFLSVLIEKD